MTISLKKATLEITKLAAVFILGYGACRTRDKADFVHNAVKTHDGLEQLLVYNAKPSEGKIYGFDSGGHSYYFEAADEVYYPDGPDRLWRGFKVYRDRKDVYPYTIVALTCHKL